MKSYKIPVIAAISLAFAIIWAYASTPSHKASTPPSAPPESRSQNTVAAVGLVEPESENINISCPVPGLVTSVFVTAGDRVKSGQKLFAIDDRDLVADLRVKEAALQAAKSRLEKLQEQPRTEDIPPAEAKVREAEANLADAEVQMNLIESVQDRRAVRAEDVQRRRIAYQAAQARLGEARSQLALIKAGAWVPDLAVARAEVSQAEAMLDQVKTNIQRLTTSAPMDGIVLQKKVRVGQYAQCSASGDPLMILGGGSHLNVRADIDEADAWRVRANTPTMAFPRGNTEQKYNLEFVRFEPYVAPKKSLTGDSNERVDTRVLQVIYRVHDPAASIYVGQQVDVYIDTPVQAAAVRPATSGGQK